MGLEGLSEPELKPKKKPTKKPNTKPQPKNPQIRNFYRE